MQEAFIILTWGLGASINGARKNFLKKLHLSMVSDDLWANNQKCDADLG